MCSTIYGEKIEYIASDVAYIDFEDIATDPETGGFVAKPFSVAENRTVTFSPGNLQYHAANNEWRFAPSQLDYIGEDNANISDTYNGWIDLFGWGTGNNPTNKSTYSIGLPLRATTTRTTLSSTQARCTWAATISSTVGLCV